MNKLDISWAASLCLVGAMLTTPAAMAEENCTNSECTVTFEYTGQQQTWQIPNGAVNIRFEIYGAQGGNGGQGGKTTGILINIPDELHIYVGGAGAIGAGAAGGFNGGGQAGGSRGNEGSGGGATDLRIGFELHDRIAVAGGGGGIGGYSGAPGAAGGGLVAASGGSGQGGGGGGGTQEGPGAAGISNGGGGSTAGSFGYGGTGGSVWSAGGGGGGGGWYGGGGGGSDENTCCSDGGGGGGGSSYASSDYVTAAEHFSGGRGGNGLAIIHYEMRLSIINSNFQQTDSASMQLNIEFSHPALDLASGDFTASSGCEVVIDSIDDSFAAVKLVSCSDGPVEVIIAPMSVGQGIRGPDQGQSFYSEFDGTGPNVSLYATEITSNSSSVVGLEISETLAMVSLSEGFQIEGCESIDYPTAQNSYLSLSSCADGLVSVKLLQYSLFDAWGNAGPESDVTLEFLVDTQPAQITLDHTHTTSDTLVRYELRFTASEPVTISSDALTFEYSTSCSHSISLTNQGGLATLDCGEGSGLYSIDLSKVLDVAGNAGAEVLTIDLAFEFAVVEQSMEFVPVEAEPDGIDSSATSSPIEVDEAPSPITVDSPTFEPVSPIANPDSTAVISETDSIVPDVEESESISPVSSSDEETMVEAEPISVQVDTGSNEILTESSESLENTASNVSSDSSVISPSSSEAVALSSETESSVSEVESSDSEVVVIYDEISESLAISPEILDNFFAEAVTTIDEAEVGISQPTVTEVVEPQILEFLNPKPSTYSGAATEETAKQQTKVTPGFESDSAEIWVAEDPKLAMPALEVVSSLDRPEAQQQQNQILLISFTILALMLTLLGVWGIRRRIIGR